MIAAEKTRVRPANSHPAVRGKPQPSQQQVEGLAEMFAATAFAFSEAADNELLLWPRFDLQPIG
jgi:hypothetical protein